MRILRILLVSALAAGVLLLVVAAAWAARERLRDPLAALQRKPGDVRVLADSSYGFITGAGERRVFRDLTLATEGIGTVRVTTSRPVRMPAEPLPLVVVLGGLRTGREALGFIEAHGANLLVGYEYPYSQETWYQGTRLAQIPAIRSAVLSVPAQVGLVARTLMGDASVDARRSALLGYSFGAMFVPAAQRLAMTQGTPFHALILAFGGADIEALLDANLKVRPAPLRRALAWLGATALHPMEPAHHLPQLPGRFLLIRGDLDEQIPPASSARMARLTPEPKRVVALESGHMGPRDPELTASVVRISQAWLTEQRVIEPPPGGDQAPAGERRAHPIVSASER